MLTINNTRTCRHTCNTQNNQKSDSPKLQTLTRDTISFKAREKGFITSLRQLCKEGHGDRNLLDKIEGLAHDVDPMHPDVVAEFDKIEKDKTIAKGVKAWILEDLPQCIGIGGNEVL